MSLIKYLMFIDDEKIELIKQIINVIEEENIITVFRHEHPDCDALGSQFGFIQFIKDNYPNKKIYALGNETSDQYHFPNSDTLDDEVIKDSVAIVLDTANTARIDDKRFTLAKYIIKIDHHPSVESYGKYNFVDDKAAAVCEILAYLLTYFSKNTISSKTAEYLYTGLLTDTLCFKTSNTTPRTLLLASKIAEKGLNIPKINRELFDRDLESFEFSGWIRSHHIFDEGVAYTIVSIDDATKFNQTPGKARNFIDELGHVKEFKMWAIFTEKPKEEYPDYYNSDEILYDGSLRSKEIPINILASKYNGGGHPCASGVKNLTSNDIKNLIKEMKKLLK